MYIGAEAWPDLESYLEKESLTLVLIGSNAQRTSYLPMVTDYLIVE